jgi:hypothetical protein
MLDPVDEAIDEVMATFDPDAAAPVEEAAPAASSATTTSPSPATRESTQSSEPVDAAASDAESSAESSEPDLAAQIADLTQRYESLNQQATQREQEVAAYRQREAEAARRAQEAQRLYALEQAKQQIAQLPDLDPAEQQQAVYRLMQMAAQPHQQQAQQASQEAERAFAYITVNHLTQQYALSEDEQRTMATMYEQGPQAMEQFAKSVSAAKVAKDTEMAGLRQQLTELQRQVAAQGRINSGADRVSNADGAGAGNDLDALSDFDEWFDAMYEQNPIGRRTGMATSAR